MGPEGDGKFKFYLKVDGKTVEINPEFAKIKFPGDQQGKADMDQGKYGLTMRMKIPKNMRCRSRKRFVKLLMASGFYRNTANVLAEGAVVWRNRRGLPDCMKESYQSYFTELWLRGIVR